MMRKVRTLLLVGALGAALTTLVPATVAADRGIRAVMDGKPITLEQARSLSCHDFDFPVLTCFATSQEMEAAAAAKAQAHTRQASGSVEYVTTTGYVIVYVDGAYGGASRAISQDYSYLGDIGWNDVISSLRSYGASGRFFEHAPPSGLVYYFYSTTQVSYVGDIYNDKFSSVDLN